MWFSWRPQHRRQFRYKRRRRPRRQQRIDHPHGRRANNNRVREKGCPEGRAGHQKACTVDRYRIVPAISDGAARRTAIDNAAAQIGMPPSIVGTFQGTAQAFQSSLASEPYLIVAALVAVYIILGVLYESFIHPLTILSTLPSAGVGALLMLMAFHFDLSVIALIGIILLIGIVKKNGIMMVDFAI